MTYIATQSVPADAASTVRRQSLVADLDRAIRFLGSDHPHTLTVRKNLAAALKEEAARQYEILVAECKRILGPGHRHTDTARADLRRLQA